MTTKQACCPVRANKSERSVSRISHWDTVQVLYTNYDINSISMAFQRKSLQLCYFTHTYNTIIYKHASFAMSVSAQKGV